MNALFGRHHAPCRLFQAPPYLACFVFHNEMSQASEARHFACPRQGNPEIQSITTCALREIATACK